MTLSQALGRFTPTELRELAEEHGDSTVESITAGLNPNLCVANAEIAAHFGRLWLAWAEERVSELRRMYRLEDERDAEVFLASLDRRGRFARDEGDIPCSHCADKYRPEGTERGSDYENETPLGQRLMDGDDPGDGVDMADLIGE